MKEIQEKEAKRDVEKAAVAAEDRKRMEELAALKSGEAAGLDKDYAEAQRKEISDWRRKKALNAEQKRREEKALVEKAQAEQKEKARLRADKDAQWKEDKQKRLRAHRKRLEVQAQAMQDKGGHSKSVESLPVITRHVHHHVHTGADGEMSSTQSGQPVVVDPQAETARGGAWAYPSERYSSEQAGVSQMTGPYPSERTYHFSSVEEEYTSGKETSRLDSVKKLSASMQLPRLQPLLAPPSEMRKSPSIATKLDRYGASVSKANATYSNATRVRGAIR
jgi:hypothetical protein